MKENLSEGNPAALIAVVNAQGPGSASTAIPSLWAALVSLKPGSEMVGVPASDTRATLKPIFMALMSLGILSS